jgi:hypothetical protein
MADEHEEFGPIFPQSQSQFLGLRVCQWPRANFLQPLLIIIFQTTGLSRLERFLTQAPAQLASLADQFLHPIGKARRAASGLIGLRQRLEQWFQFLGGAQEMTQAGLFVGSPERIIDAIPVGVENALKFCPTIASATAVERCRST